jgi:hypothetical protein
MRANPVLEAELLLPCIPKQSLGTRKREKKRIEVSMKDRKEIIVGLKKIVILHQLLVIIMLLFIPFALVVYIVRLPDWLTISIAAFLCLSFIIVNVSFGLCHCPECHKYFTIGSY